jgi:hypothetical protein
MERSMTDKLTWRNNGTWALVALGFALLGYWLVMLVFTIVRARAGDADIAAVAAGITLATKGIVAGIIIAAIGIAARVVLKKRKQPSQ